MLRLKASDIAYVLTIQRGLQLKIEAFFPGHFADSSFDGIRVADFEENPSHCKFLLFFARSTAEQFSKRHASLLRLHIANRRYDQWFPEPARINALKGAEILFYPTAIGYIEGEVSSDGDWHDAWKTVQRGNAIANGVHVAAVNRVGVEGKLGFWGGSFVCDSFGMMLKEASMRKEETLVVEVDLAKNKRIQDGWGFLRNRRPDSYRELVEDT